ncbi:hypothetical protein HDU77_008811 [Chytriomyces hyalinus]|nr:hypothetical protein HDU77_008811 [Chytriomyces hyalinus]
MDPLTLLPQHIRNFVTAHAQTDMSLPCAIKEEFALVAIIDISGYSKLSSMLEAALGNDSGAKIKEVINPPMDVISQHVLKYAGSIVKLAGDAVIASWTLDFDSRIGVKKTIDEDEDFDFGETAPNQNQKTLCVNALLCCVELLQVFSNYTIKVDLACKLPNSPADMTPCADASSKIEQTLKIHIGLALGSMDHIHIGGRNMKLQNRRRPSSAATAPMFGRREYFIAGEALAKAGTNLGLGDQGDFVFSSNFNEVLITTIGLSGSKHSKCGNCYVIRDSDAVHEFQLKAIEYISPTNHPEIKSLENKLPPLKSRPPNYLTYAKSYMDDSISKNMREGVVIGDQLRSVSVVFIKFASFEPENIAEKTSLKQLQSAAMLIFGKVQEYEGCVRQFNCDDKALTALLVWGLEGNAHEKGEAQVAVLAATEIAKDIGTCVDDEFGWSIGVTTGTVFAGIVGSKERCDNTILGVVVNNAARLMCLDQCQGTVLCDAETYRQTATQFNYVTTLQAVKLKGVPHPVKVYNPIGDDASRKSNKTEKTPIPGREKEAETLKMSLETWRAEPPSNETKNCVLIGSSGIGKSQMTSWLIEQLNPEEIICVGIALEHKKENLLFSWSRVFQSFLEQIEDNDQLLTKVQEFQASKRPKSQFSSDNNSVATSLEKSGSQAFNEKTLIPLEAFLSTPAVNSLSSKALQPDMTPEPLRVSVSLNRSLLAKKGTKSNPISTLKLVSNISDKYDKAADDAELSQTRSNQENSETFADMDVKASSRISLQEPAFSSLERAQAFQVPHVKAESKKQHVSEAKINHSHSLLKLSAKNRGNLSKVKSTIEGYGSCKYDDGSSSLVSMGVLNHATSKDMLFPVVTTSRLQLKSKDSNSFKSDSLGRRSHESPTIDHSAFAPVPAADDEENTPKRSRSHTKRGLPSPIVAEFADVPMYNERNASIAPVLSVFEKEKNTPPPVPQILHNALSTQFQNNATGDWEIPKILLQILQILNMPPTCLETLSFLLGVHHGSNTSNGSTPISIALSEIFNAFTDVGLKLCIILDDIQWCDSQSLEIIRSLLSKCPKVFFVLTARPAEEWRLTSVEIFTKILQEDIHTIHVLPLNSEGVESMFRAVFKFSSISPDIIRELLDRGQGNPMVTSILITSLMEEKLLMVNSGCITRVGNKELQLGMGSTAAVVAQFDKLSAPMKFILKICAISGQYFKISEVRAVLQILETEGEHLGIPLTDEAILRLLKEEDKYKFVKMGGNDQDLCFAHYLVQQGIFSSMVPSKREVIRRHFVSYYERVLDDAVGPSKTELRQNLLFHLLKLPGLDDKKKLHVYDAFVESGEANQVAEAMEFYEMLSTFDSKIELADTCYKKVREFRILARLQFEKGNYADAISNGHKCMEVLGCRKSYFSQNNAVLLVNCLILGKKVENILRIKSEEDVASAAKALLQRTFPNAALRDPSQSQSKETYARPTDEREQDNLLKEIIHFVWIMGFAYEHTKPGLTIFFLVLIMTGPSLLCRNNRLYQMTLFFSSITTTSGLFGFKVLSSLANDVSPTITDITCLGADGRRVSQISFALFNTIHKTEMENNMTLYQTFLYANIHEMMALRKSFENDGEAAAYLFRRCFELTVNQGLGTSEKAYMMAQHARISYQRLGDHEEVVRQWFGGDDVKFYSFGVDNFILAEAKCSVAVSLMILNEQYSSNRLLEEALAHLEIKPDFPDVGRMMHVQIHLMQIFICNAINNQTPALIAPYLRSVEYCMKRLPLRVYSFTRWLQFLATITDLILEMIISGSPFSDNFSQLRGSVINILSFIKSQIVRPKTTYWPYIQLCATAILPLWKNKNCTRFIALAQKAIKCGSKSDVKLAPVKLTMMKSRIWMAQSILLKRNVDYMVDQWRFDAESLRAEFAESGKRVDWEILQLERMFARVSQDLK